jgi:hypothetical protein
MTTENLTMIARLRDKMLRDGKGNWKGQPASDVSLQRLDKL